MASLGNVLSGIGAGIVGAATTYDLYQLSTTTTTLNQYNDPGTTSFYPGEIQNVANGVCMLFQFYQYQRPSILSPPTIDTNPLGNIVLPLPTELLDKQGLTYDEQGSSATMGAMLDNLAQGQGVASAASAAAAGLAAGGLDAAGNVIPTNKFLQVYGYAQNPFLSILFNNPQFKRHIFNWTFIPENANDQQILTFILNKLRYHALPDINTGSGGFGGLLLTYPDIVVPVIFPQGAMYDFKHCVIENIQINYEPGDSIAFNIGNLGVPAPNAIRLTMNLLEIEYWVKSDILNTTTAGGPGVAGINPSFGTSTSSPASGQIGAVSSTGSQLYGGQTSSNQFIPGVTNVF